MNPAYSLKTTALFVIPLFTLTVSFIFLGQLLPFYMSVPDPCYIHLFTGINLASGHWEVGNTDNPGTTVQCFAAVVIFIKHFLFSSGVPLSHDVMLNPESYLYACSVASILIFVSINYLTGAYVMRHTGSIGLSALFQVTPFINLNILQGVIVLAPEAAIIIAATYFMAYLFIKSPENNMQNIGRYKTKTTVLFALFSGFLIASKYTCAPIIILILFILENNKQRLLYAGMVMVSFFIFIIPALPKIGNMLHWVWNLITHDGIYGTGEKRVINPALFLANLKQLMISDTVFSSLYGIITLAFLIVLLNRIIKRKTIPFFRITLGIWFCITTLILVTAKHSKFHYLIFAECCFPLGMITSYKVVSGFFLQDINYYKNHKKKIVWVFFVLFVIFLVVEKIRYLPVRQFQPMLSGKYLEEYKTSPLIISIKSSVECECIEPSLYLGYTFSGNRRYKYGQFLETAFPNSYICWTYVPNLYHWNETLSFPDFFMKNSNNNVLIYMKGFDDTAQVNLLHKFSGWAGTAIMDKFKVQKIFSNSNTRQSIYLMEPRDTVLQSDI